MDADKLRSYLECPVCLLLPRNKIFFCTNGHKICESCFNKLKGAEGAKICPQGDCNYDRPPRRARDAEAMIKDSNLNLGCSKPGCLVEMRKDDLDAHETSCIFREVPCPELSCHTTVLFKTLDLHIRENHKDSVDIFREAGFEFYPTFMKQDGFWYFWIKMKADKLAAASWSYHAKSENVELGLLVEFTGSVQPVDLGVKEIIESGQYMLFNKHTVMKLKVKATGRDEYPDKIDISFKLFKKLTLLNVPLGSNVSGNLTITAVAENSIVNDEETLEEHETVKDEVEKVGTCPMCQKEMEMKVLIDHAGDCQG